MVTPSVVTATAGETGHAAFGEPDARMAFTAGGATKEIAAFHFALLKWKLVCPPLTRNTEIVAGLPPLGSMRLQATTASAILRQQMRQFMQEGLFDFLLGNFTESGIKPDLGAGDNGHAGSCSHARIPTDDEPLGKFGSECAQRFSRFLFQLRVSLPSLLFDGRMTGNARILLPSEENF